MMILSISINLSEVWAQNRVAVTHPYRRENERSPSSLLIIDPYKDSHGLCSYLMGANEWDSFSRKWKNVRVQRRITYSKPNNRKQARPHHQFKISTRYLIHKWYAMPHFRPVSYDYIYLSNFISIFVSVRAIGGIIEKLYLGT